MKSNSFHNALDKNVAFDVVTQPSDEFLHKLYLLSGENCHISPRTLRATSDSKAAFRVFAVTEGEKITVFGIAREFGGWIARRLVFRTLPRQLGNSPEAIKCFWDGIKTYCKSRHIVALDLWAFDSLPIEVSSLGISATVTSRQEYLIDLEEIRQEHLRKLSKNHQRNIRKGERAGLSFEIAQTFEACVDHSAMMEQSMGRRVKRGESVRYRRSPEKWYAYVRHGAGSIMRATLNGACVSSLLILETPRQAYYVSGGSNSLGMKTGASHFLMWNVIQHLSDEGVSSLNLGGVTEHDSPGLARFKAGFGARAVELPHRRFIVDNRWRSRTFTKIRLLRESPREFSHRIACRVPGYNLARLPNEAKRECFRDLRGLPTQDPGIKRGVEEAIGWIGRAQDNSSTADGGIARHYSLISGWGPSYPETTGYLVPTLLDFARAKGDKETRERARRMLDWLVSIQFPAGGFQGGCIGEQPHVPVTFNTGQILIGLAAGVSAFGDVYLEPMKRAADWLVATQDADGCWRNCPSPMVCEGEKSYDIHVAWGLFEAARIVPNGKYGEAGLANVEWALGEQHDNGWLDKCCLTDPSKPLTHTIGYTLRGFLEAYRFSHENRFIEAARRTADGLLTAIKKDGFLSGRLHADWTPVVRWACLTGTSQIAYCWLILYKITGERRYRDAAYIANRYVRRTMDTDGSPGTRGAIKGSFPVYGGYGTYQYLNWACKFFVDANMLEEAIREKDSTNSY